MPSLVVEGQPHLVLAVGKIRENNVQFADIILAVVGTGLAAWLFDAMTGRRGLFAALLVAGTGAISGWFLAVRVFAVASMDQWLWVTWALGGATISLICFLLFRSKR